MNNLRRRFSKTRGKIDRNYLTFTAEEANSTIKLNKIGNLTSAKLEYSTNGGNSWNPLVVGSTTITLAPNDKHYKEVFNQKSKYNRWFLKNEFKSN